MANDVNSVVLVGRLTKNVELKYTASAIACGSISIAVNRSVKKGDQWTDEVNFFEGVMFGKQIEALSPYLLKGKQVAIKGCLRQERWQQDGQNRSKVSIVVDNIQLLGGKNENQQATQEVSQFSSMNKPVDNNVVSNNNSVALPDDFDDDIPF